jgi:hypothetical protein
MEVHDQLHIPTALPSDTHLIGGWVDSRASENDMEKRNFFPLPEIEPKLLSHLAHTQIATLIAILAPLIDL